MCTNSFHFIRNFRNSFHSPPRVCEEPSSIWQYSNIEKWRRLLNFPWRRSAFARDVPDVHPAEEIVVDLEILSFSIQANLEKREVRCG